MDRLPFRNPLIRGHEALEHIFVDDIIVIGVSLPIPGGSARASSAQERSSSGYYPRFEFLPLRGWDYHAIPLKKFDLCRFHRNETPQMRYGPSLFRLPRMSSPNPWIGQ